MILMDLALKNQVKVLKLTPEILCTKPATWSSIVTFGIFLVKIGVFVEINKTNKSRWHLQLSGNSAFSQHKLPSSVTEGTDSEVSEDDANPRTLF